MSSPQDQWLDSRLTLRSELKFDARHMDQTSFVVIEDPVRSKFFQVGSREYRFVASIDGKKTPREITESLNRKLVNGEEAYDEESVV